MNDLLTIRQIEDIAGTLRKYRLTPADALTVAKALVHAVDGPVAIRPEDLASLMRPRRPAPEKDAEAAKRRQEMRARLSMFGFYPGEFMFNHHQADYEAVRSAVQYRARQAGLTASITKVDQGNVLVTLGG